MSFITVVLKLVGLLGDKWHQRAISLIFTIANRNSIIGRALKKELVKYWRKNNQLQLIQKLVPTNSDDTNTFLNSLTINQLSQIDNILMAKVEKSLKKINTKNETVAIYLVGQGYTENLGKIPFYLHEKGFNVLGLIGNSPAQVAEMYHEACKKVKIEACICVGLIEEMPEDTKVIYFVHDIYDSPLTNIKKIHKLMPKCHFIVVPNEPALCRYKDKVLEGREKFYKNGNTPEVCFIRAGYPKFDSNTRYFDKYNNKPPTAIIYATTIIEDIEDVVSIPQYGSQIIQAILSEIPDRTLIFRPHPGTLGSKEVDSIVKKYQRHPRFVFDNNPSFYMKNYANSSVMVSDMSGTAYTFAFSTLRPVIFFSHNEVEVQKRFGSYQYFKDREKVGYVAENINEMVEKIKLLLATGDKFSPRIKEYRDSIIYNVGKSEDYFMDNFEHIIKNKRHPDWEYI